MMNLEYINSRMTICSSVSSSVLFCCCVVAAAAVSSSVRPRVDGSCGFRPVGGYSSVQERVFYFPQGHMEQLEASTNQELNHEAPLFNLPSKILCRVLHVQLMAEQETDEVYAQITLQPETDQSEPMSPDPFPMRLRRGQFIPSLFCSGYESSYSNSGLIAKDLHGTSGGSSIYIGATSETFTYKWWSTLSLLRDFVRGDNGELRVGIRRLAHQQSTIHSSVISSQSMHLGVLATAAHAVTTQTFFVVSTSQGSNFISWTSQFIIGANKYLEAINNGFSIGMRFKMRFEGSRDHSRCWRHFPTLIQWDEPATIQRPERVSPWEIEPFPISTSISLVQPALKNKRPRTVYIPASEMTANSDGLAFWCRGSTVSHELTQVGTGSTAEVQSRDSQVIWPWTERMDSSFVQSRPCKALKHDLVEKGKNSERSTGCRLFGFNLRYSSNAVGVTDTASSPIDPNTETSKSSKEQKQVATSETSTKEIQAKQGTATSMRTRAKVQMQGIAVGRAVDLASLKGYNDLINELERMFDIEGELSPRSKWSVVFTDDEGDMMLVGDDPWLEFCKMVRKIFIYSIEEVTKISAKCKFPASPLEGEGTVVSLDSET
ncbi:Auxin response factor 11 isoform 2 [Hibiscus syriacus]|uniref:Auxin-responsive protein n=1 Tax=Hibiscus syriacus TaxID=106335 RepID=A0A6A3C6T3_HIBSY|nr:Auxin response factor 11 isoform 2 [Hibiscus syriacus]